MANEITKQNQTAVAAPSAEKQWADYKNKITTSVLNRIAALKEAGGLTIPENYAVGNQLNLAMLRLATMEDRDGKLVLSYASSASVANALFTMCILGLSLEKAQCYFIPYGKEIKFQMSYLGKIALAKRIGGAGEPQAQVIYENDEFEYIINPKTGKKEVLKHVQKLENIDNAKIVGAWCLVPYEKMPEKEPKVEIMTIAEIRQAWMQGATKGASPAHNKFTQEMAKKSVISRAMKSFLSTSDDAGLSDALKRDDAEYQEQPSAMPMKEEAVFEPVEIPAVIAPAPEIREETKPVEVPASAPMQEETEVDPGFFSAE